MTEKIDIVVSNHYWRLKYLDALMNMETKPGPVFMLPDISTATVTQQGQLPLSSTPLNQSKKWTVLHYRHSSSLISFGQLCDDKFKVNLYKIYCYVMKDKYLILQ